MVERIEIFVTDRGTREVKRNLDDLGGAANKSGNALSLLRKTLLLLGGAAVLKRLIDFVDVFNNMQNKVRVVTKTIEELNVVTEELFGIAQRTRSSFEATTEVFTRTALAVRELGISQQETLEFTESLNQAIILSGATAQEAAAGMIQLSQGLASGTLRGDELRSVLEQLPAVADVIAKSLGVTRGELRGLGEEGKLTANVILKAFREARGELATKFAKTVPTIGQSFTVLRNAIIQAIGQFDKATGASRALAKSIIFVAEHAVTMVRLFSALAITVGTVFGTIAINKAVAGVRALTIAIAANPIGAILVVITAVIAALIAFSDQILITANGFATLQDFAQAAFEQIKLIAGDLFTVLKENLGIVSTLFKDVFGDAQIDMSVLLTFAAAFADRFIGLIVGTVNAAVTAFQNLPKALKDIFQSMITQAQKDTQTLVNKIITGLNKIPGVDIELVNFDKIEHSAEGGAKKLGDTVKDAFLQGFNLNTIGDALDKTFTRAEQIAKDRLAKTAQDKSAADAAKAGLRQTGPNVTPLPGTKELNENLKQLRGENELLRLNGVERLKLHEILKIEKDIKRSLTDEERKTINALVEEQALLQARSTLLEEIKGPQAQLAVQQQALNQLLAEGAITVSQYELALTKLKIQMLDAGTTAAEGFKRGFEKIKAEILDVASAAEKTLTNAFHSAEDALVEFVTTGQVNFSKLVDSILADLTRLLARQALAALINGPGGGGGGGWIGAIAGLFGGAKAEGGPVSAGRAFLVGERGPELFVPKAAGNVMPNESLQSMAAAPPPNVNVSVVNVSSPDEVPEAMSSQRGDKVILNSVTRNRGAFKNALGIA